MVWIFSAHASEKEAFFKSVEWFVCLLEHVSLRIHLLSLFSSWLFNSFSRSSFQTFHTILYLSGPWIPSLFSHIFTQPPHVPPHEGREPLIALFFVLIWIPGGTAEGIKSCLLPAMHRMKGFDLKGDFSRTAT